MAKYVVNFDELEPMAFDVSSSLASDVNIGADLRGVLLSEVRGCADREIISTGLTFDEQLGRCVCDICGGRMGFSALQFRFCPFCGNEIRGGIKNGRKETEDKL